MPEAVIVTTPVVSIVREPEVEVLIPVVETLMFPAPPKVRA